MENVFQGSRSGGRAADRNADAGSRGALARTARCVHELAPTRGLVLARAGPRCSMREKQVSL
eukprot:161129-Prymnesium_polylepis.1